LSFYDERIVMKYLLSFVAISLVINTYAMQNSESDFRKNGLGNRPPEVQDAVNRAFEQNKNATSWPYDGSYYYTLMGIDEEKLFALLVCDEHKNDIYIVDVGCGKGGWGRLARNFFLRNEAWKNSGKRIHIFSITGGRECEDIVEQTDHVTLYQLNQFKIENIDEEFSKRGFNLKNKVDVIVSNWTLRHLVDPFRTLEQMYNLLADKGILMSNGFLFKLDDSAEVKVFPSYNRLYA
jgi:hypothetical protein